MLNRAILTGRLTRDPELRYTTSGTAVVQATIAVDRQFKNQQGEREADFINLVIWRKAAENFANFTHKGSLVGIDGRIQTRTYENKQGQRVYVTEINVDSFSLLEPRQENNQQPNNNYSSQVPNNNATSNSPRQNQNAQLNYGNQNNDFGNGGQSIDLADDELPF
ncbi:single-stranded DNA-binding protein [Limosilactobacillus reuteri]|uniref:Single-stranded DNA-binding protein n=1 Tax=Limosilactobacillus reuteri TaxID=1598 RepID=A0AAW4X4U3_LIMRT|nr:single-stranded DNA-binding protein [Limosilactobacillus reuteri]MCC4477446.1 single-stranded DNA-binding protein [Limosilactobacillus reuteri]MCC4479723.1 single-stranded DNA-binding protein [Limosilactobacillus reuteri]MCC4488971.1 single-stranded DNA-binding protein [Limosilactobacillus reuteri]MCC4493331.1 single-stranded DNA-binding protein [Limosilactobacillus reuteri]MCC4495998.1 single-stranded DNA-binding protein [Limosilactobacillus reuteri]